MTQGNEAQAPSSQVTALRAIAPARSGNIFEETIECLLQIIRLGIIPPGQRFPPERELAEQLRVSRATLREAMSELQTAGWVNVRRGRGGGTFVSRNPAEAWGHGTAHASGADEIAGFSPAEVEDTLTWRRRSGGRAGSHRTPTRSAGCGHGHEQAVEPGRVPATGLPAAPDLGAGHGVAEPGALHGGKSDSGE